MISNQNESLPLSGTLASGDYLVVAQSLDSSTNGGVEADILMDGFSLPDFTSLITVEYDHNETTLTVDSLQLNLNLYQKQEAVHSCHHLQWKRIAMMQHSGVSQHLPMEMEIWVHLVL